MQGNKKVLVFLGILGAVIFLILIAFLRQQINTFLIKPFLIVVNSVSEFLAIFNQNIIWISFLIIFSLTLLIVIYPFKRRNSGIRSKYPLPLSRLSLWRRHLKNFSKGNYMKWRFGQRMSFLILRTMALKYNLPDKNLMNRINQTYDELPEYLYEYIAVANKPYLKPGKPQKMILTGKSDRSILESVTPEMVVSYLEKELLIAPSNESGNNYD